MKESGGIFNVQLSKTWRKAPLLVHDLSLFH